jgi:drug/metabolite transporter (DMT)-like permease
MQLRGLQRGCRRLNQRRGVWYALGAAVLFGASAPLAKALLHDAPPQLLAGLLYAGSGVGLAVVSLVQRGRSHRTEAPLTRSDAPWLVAAIFFGGVVGPVLLMFGLVKTPASSASLLLNLEGVFTVTIAWFVFRENVDRRIALGMMAIVAGGVALSWEGRAELGGIGWPLAIAGACLCWAIDNNLTQKVSGADPVRIAMLKGLAAGIVNIAIASVIGASWPPWRIVAGTFVIGFLSYGVSLVLFVLALRHLGTARTGAYFSVAPFVGAALAIVGWHERPTLFFGIAAACMAFGVWLHLSEHHEHEHVHDEMDHEHAHVHDEHHQHDHGPDDPPVTDPVPHSHAHRHQSLVHSHPHYPDLHHRHSHGPDDPSVAPRR